MNTTKNNSGTYERPEVEVIDLQERGFICVSDGTNEGTGDEELNP